MTPGKRDEDLLSLKQTVRVQRIWLFGCFCLLFLLAVTLTLTVGRVRTVVTPPTIAKTFWVDEDKVSGSYLVQMGEFVAHQILDVTPDNLDYKASVVLQYVTPDTHGALKTRMELTKDRLKRESATMLFWPKSITPDEDKVSVLLQGNLATYINGALTSNPEKTYLAQFRYQGGKLLLTAFKEVSGNDPNALQATAARD